MNIALLIIGVVVAAIVVFVVYRRIVVQKQSQENLQKRMERVQFLIDKLENGHYLTREEVEVYARNLLTREMTFQLLRHHDKTDLFPRELYTIERSAESNLANWLEFPTELGACPDEMEHIRRVTIDYDGKNNLVHYEVFKYRIGEPHWAASNGWMLGVVGPYFDDSDPYDNAHATFSRCESTVDKVSPEEEAKWVHENISKRR